MRGSRLRFEPHTLRRRIVDAGRRALRDGSLAPIPTVVRVVEDEGIPFVVRVLAGLGAKPAGRAGDRDPFLPPYEAALFVSDISDTHVALLNKFNVIEHHTLLVTRRFEPQQAPLDEADLVAACACLAELGGVVFYNAGTIAGASQPHKHLQWVPDRLGGGEETSPPLAPPIEEGLAPTGPGQAPRLPFRHAVTRVDPAWLEAPEDSGPAWVDAYAGMLRAADPGGDCPATPAHNFLATKRWMMLVPRSRECFGSVSVNALGFAGSLLARDERELDLVREAGPMSVLRWVAWPRRATHS